MYLGLNSGPWGSAWDFFMGAAWKECWEETSPDQHSYQNPSKDGVPTPNQQETNYLPVDRKCLFVVNLKVILEFKLY